MPIQSRRRRKHTCRSLQGQFLFLLLLFRSTIFSIHFFGKRRRRRQRWVRRREKSWRCRLFVAFTSVRHWGCICLYSARCGGVCCIIWWRSFSWTCCCCCCSWHCGSPTGSERLRSWLERVVGARYRCGEQKLLHHITSSSPNFSFSFNLSSTKTSSLTTIVRHRSCVPLCRNWY